MDDKETNIGDCLPRNQEILHDQADVGPQVTEHEALDDNMDDQDVEPPDPVSDESQEQQGVPEASVNEPQTTRSGHLIKQPQHFDDFLMYESIVGDTCCDTVDAYTDHVDPMSLTLIGNQDNFYYHEIAREANFLKAKQEKIKMHNQQKNWEPVLFSTLPPHVKVIPLVWTMRCKRRLTDGSIHKWKAGLNVDGSKQIRGVNYWETYAPVAQWVSIRLVLCLVALNKWKVKSFDFVQAFPQAPSEPELYIDVPKGCLIGDDISKWAMRVVNNIYGQKQAG
jgi:Reverse transcriptase (RNA-dependent DNA polymerase)